MTGDDLKSARATGRSPLHLLESLAIFIIFSSIYLAYLSSQYNFDGAVFALRVEQAVATGNVWELFHPRHLFYEPAGYILFRLAHALGSELRSIVWLEIMNAMFGAAALCLFHRLALRLGMGRLLGAGMTGCLAFSFGFWFFSVEPEVYVPGVFFLLVGLWMLFRFIEKGKAGLFPAALLGIIAAIAILNHVVNSLFLIPMGLATLFYLRNKESIEDTNPSLNFSSFIIMILVCFAVTLSVYYEAGTHSPLAEKTGAWKWFLGLADPETPFGYRKSYWAFHYTAAFHWVQGMAKTLFATDSYRLSQKDAFDYLIYIAVALLIFLLAFYFIRIRKISIEDRKYNVLLWLWLAPYAVFTIIWEPKNFELKVFFLAPFFLLIGLGLKGVSGRIKIFKAAPALLAALLFVINFYSSILPGADAKNNLDLQRSYFIRDNTEPPARIYIAGVSGGYNKGKIYIPCFSRRQAIVMDWRMRDMMKQGGVIDLRVKPGTYVLEELVVTGRALDKLATNHGISSSEIRRAFLRYRLKLIARHDEEFAIYLINSP